METEKIKLDKKTGNDLIDYEARRARYIAASIRDGYPEGGNEQAAKYIIESINMILDEINKDN